jgi:hypothetical protein
VVLEFTCTLAPNWLPLILTYRVLQLLPYDLCVGPPDVSADHVALSLSSREQFPNTSLAIIKL